MSKISMSGRGEIGELCEKLEKMLDEKAGMLSVCELLESTRRRVGDMESAVMIFEHTMLWGSRYYETFSISLCSDGKGIVADVLTRSSGKLFSKGDKLALLAADALRELGFEDFERESWQLESEAKPAEPDAFEEYGDYLSPNGWKKAAGGAREQGVEAEAEPARAEPERRAKRGKRSYDPEI